MKKLIFILLPLMISACADNIDTSKKGPSLKQRQMELRTEKNTTGTYTYKNKAPSSNNKVPASSHYPTKGEIIRNEY